LTRASGTLLSIAALGLPGRLLVAQCPDGTPPPCRTAARAVRVDADAVAILPFRVAGPPEAQYLREGMVDLLNVGLDGFAGWRVLQPRAFLRTVAGSERAIEPAEGARLAREAGAASFVLGSLTVAGSEVVGQAALYESARGTSLTSVRVRGSSAQPAAVADSIAAGLARYRATRQPGVVRRPTSDYTTSSPTALLAYLVSEQLTRKGRWAEAIDSLTSAIAHDSTFGLAYYGLLRAISWGTATPIIRVSWGSTSSTLTTDIVFAAAARHRDRAPQRQRRLLDALAMTNRVDQLRTMDELSRSYPDDADIALESGDSFFHQGLQMGESPRVALGRLERAIVLDPGAPEPYLHVIELQSMLGDTAAAWRTLQRLREVAPGWSATPALELGLRAMRGEDPATLPAADSDVLARAARYVLWLGDAEPARAIAIADAFTARRAAAGAPVADRLPALLQRHVFALARGRYRPAWDLLREAASLDPEGAEVLGATVIHQLVTRNHEAEAADAARRLLARAGVRPLWASSLLGWRAASLAPIDSARGVLPALLAGADWPDYRASHLAGLNGMLDLRRGDSASARRGLIRGNSEWIETRGVEALSPGPSFALLAARLDLAAGDLEPAISRLSETIASIGPIFRAEAEELRGVIAERRRDPAAVIRAYRNVMELWAEADPALQPRVAAARAALARLE